MKPEIVKAEAINKATKRLIKRLNLKPTIKDSAEMNITMISLALASQLRRGQVFANILIELSRLAHEALDDCMTGLEEQLAQDDLSAEDRASLRTHLEIRQLEHAAIAHISAAATAVPVGRPTKSKPTVH